MIDFAGIDLLADRAIAAPPIRRGVAEALSIDVQRVAVIEDISQYPKPGLADVVCVVTTTQGDFSQLISIQCAPLKLLARDVLELVQKLATSWGAGLLAPAGGPNPYIVWFIAPATPARQASLDEASFDEERYVLRAT